MDPRHEQPPPKPVQPLDYYSPAETRPLDKTSLFSLISALLLCVPFITGIAAIVLGRMGLRRTEDPNIRGRRLAKAGFYLGIASCVLWLLLTPMMVMGIMRAREAALQAVCMSHMRSIGLVLHMYANEWNGHLPDDLGALVTSRYILGTAIFTCPATEPPPSGLSYTYLGQGLQLSRIRNASQFVLAHEDPGNHRRMGVLYADLHVEGHEAPESLWILAELEAGTNPPRPMPAGWQPPDLP
jgi:hypothetical protein